MRMTHAAAAAVAASALLIVAPLGVTANARGGLAVHFANFRGHSFSSRFRAAYNQWPLYGWYLDIPSGNYNNTAPYLLPEPIALMAEPPQALSCEHSEQTVTVPAEEGGTRQIRIVRC